MMATKLSAKDAAVLGLAKPAKYRNRRTAVDGVKFDSRKEARRFGELKLLEQAGTISGLRRQVWFDLVVNGVKVCRYVADAVYEEAGVTVVEDVKSPATRRQRLYRLKAKLMLACHGVQIRES